MCIRDRVSDNRGRKICGHTLVDGEKIIIVDDLITTGKTLCERIDQLKEQADIDVVAVIAVSYTHLDVYKRQV